MTPDKPERRTGLDQIEPVLADVAQKTDRLIESNGQILVIATRADANAEIAARGVADLTIEMRQRFENVDLRFTQVNERFDQVDHRFVRVGERFDQVDHRFVLVDERFDQVDQRFVRVDERFDQQQAQMDQRFDQQQVQIDHRFEQQQNQIDELRTEMREGFVQVNQKFEQVSQTQQQILTLLLDRLK
ncbi:hypothetical protein [Spirosoma foliorum]|uniref:t-SNARE coiled-coil homology domain-containing protein n=1 Tax=Spirosoma foliorum TaxID=2710596 RepID=A0A7G5GWF6_9BACT|nr:hypothetical protein [Spirosoma foliorum]QMW03198.1 hypothetical protein H3H32_35920 [Spirosoma foliorum]